MTAHQRDRLVAERRCERFADRRIADEHAGVAEVLPDIPDRHAGGEERWIVIHRPQRHVAHRERNDAGGMGVNHRHHIRPRPVNLGVDEALEKHAALDTDGRHAEQVLEINEVIDQLGKVFPRMAQVVSLRFYVGLGDAEIGTALGIDERTVRRDWIKARGWMIGRLREAE